METGARSGVKSNNVDGRDAGSQEFHMVISNGAAGLIAEIGSLIAAERHRPHSVVERGSIILALTFAIEFRASATNHIHQNHLRGSVALHNGIFYEVIRAERP